jgi:DNA-binding NarL/FixJ family response regulator
LLIDIGLPDGNGLDLLKDVEGKETSVVVFSGQDVPPAMANRITAILTKSRTSNAELLMTLQRVIGG